MLVKRLSSRLITHKVALLLKKELEADPDWERFISQSNLARRGLALTAAGFLVPPALKAKARYMNVDCLVTWGQKVLAYLRRLHQLSDDRVSSEAVDVRRVEARLGWLRRYRRRLREWSALLAVAQAAEHDAHHPGPRCGGRPALPAHPSTGTGARHQPPRQRLVPGTPRPHSPSPPQTRLCPRTKPAPTFSHL